MLKGVEHSGVGRDEMKPYFRGKNDRDNNRPLPQEPPKGADFETRMYFIGYMHRHGVLAARTGTKLGLNRVIVPQSQLRKA